MSRRDGTFEMQGRLIEFSEIKHGRPLRMLLEADGQIHSLKISKHIRLPDSPFFHPGAHVLVKGEQTWESPDEVKRKAFLIELIEGAIPDPAAPSTRAGALDCIRVCSRSNCWKNGGKQIYRALKEMAKEQIEGNVVIDTTKCLGHCDHPPALICLPAGRVHDHVQLQDIPEILGLDQPPA